MRVLVLSSVYPSASRPTFGVFVRERVRHVAARCEVCVVAPIAWFPGNRRIRGREAEFASAVLRALDRPWDREAIVARASAMGLGRTADQTMEEFRLALATGHTVSPHAASG